MHYIDELLALYPGKDPFTRKFILAQILDQPADHFAGEIGDTLRNEFLSTDAIVRRQARYTLGQVLPAHVIHEYRLQASPDGTPSPEGQRCMVGAAAWLEAQLEEAMTLMCERGTASERAAA